MHSLTNPAEQSRIMSRLPLPPINIVIAHPTPSFNLQLTRSRLAVTPRRTKESSASCSRALLSRAYSEGTVPVRERGGSDFDGIGYVELLKNMFCSSA